MKRQQWAYMRPRPSWWLAWVGRRFRSTLLVAGLVLIAVMMFVMMRGMHSGASGHDSYDHQHHSTADRTDDPRSAGRR
jgi:hypothetical protein